MTANVVNHVGLCVTDLERSRAFYEALGFVFERELRPPDDLTGRLLGIDPPVGLTAVYLTIDTFVLELLHFGRDGNPLPARRAMDEPGLTHLSITVDDVPETLELVRRFGGEVSSDIGLAVMVRDPDGQLLELMPAKRP